MIFSVLVDLQSEQTYNDSKKKKIKKKSNFEAKSAEIFFKTILTEESRHAGVCFAVVLRKFKFWRNNCIFAPVQKPLSKPELRTKFEEFSIIK